MISFLDGIGVGRAYTWKDGKASFKREIFQLHGI